MAAKVTELIALETRKQLLLVESELDRMQLLNELRDFKNEIQQAGDQMRAVSLLALSAAKLVATFSAIGRVFAHRDED